MSARMPAEWAPHERTIMCWPARESMWQEHFTAAQAAHAEVANAIAAFEPVLMVADPASPPRRGGTAAPGVEVVELPLDDSWARDSGPIFLLDDDGGARRASSSASTPGAGSSRRGTTTPCSPRACSSCWGRSAATRTDLILEGGSITVDGEGTLITTEQCLLEEHRNPQLAASEIEARLKRHLGVERVVWLGLGLVEDDDTDGHVDNICAFVEPGKVVLQTVPTRPTRTSRTARRTCGGCATPASRSSSCRGCPTPRARSRRSSSRTRTTTSATAGSSSRPAGRRPTPRRSRCSARSTPGASRSPSAARCSRSAAAGSTASRSRSRAAGRLRPPTRTVLRRREAAVRPAGRRRRGGIAGPPPPRCSSATAPLRSRGRTATSPKPGRRAALPAATMRPAEAGAAAVDEREAATRRVGARTPRLVTATENFGGLLAHDRVVDRRRSGR